MSGSSSNTQVAAGGSISLWIVAYLAAYVVASGLDLWTTDLVIRAGGSEANVYATNAGIYNAAKALGATAAGALVMVWMFAFGLRHAQSVSPHWLAQPMRSFLRIYANPWSKSVIDRSPLHAISCAVAFVVLRLFAAENNAAILMGATGPIGAAVRAAGRATSPELGFALTIGALYLALTVALAPWSAKLVTRFLKARRSP